MVTRPEFYVPRIPTRATDTSMTSRSNLPRDLVKHAFVVIVYGRGYDSGDVFLSGVLRILPPWPSPPPTVFCRVGGGGSSWL